MEPIQLARRLFTIFQDAYKARGQGLWSITVRDNEEALGFTVEEARAAVTILMHKGLVKWMGHSLTLTEKGNEACLHPQLLERALGPLEPQSKRIVLSPSSITVHGGHVQIGDNNTQNITYRAVLRKALEEVASRSDLPPVVAASLRGLVDFPDLEELLSRAAAQCGERS
jgi:hypothetical protein